MFSSCICKLSFSSRHLWVYLLSIKDWLWIQLSALRCNFGLKTNLVVEKKPSEGLQRVNSPKNGFPKRRHEVILNHKNVFRFAIVAQRHGFLMPLRTAWIVFLARDQHDERRMKSWPVSHVSKGRKNKCKMTKCIRGHLSLSGKPLQPLQPLHWIEYMLTTTATT